MVEVTLPIPPSVNAMYVVTESRRIVPTREAEAWKTGAHLVAKVAARKAKWRIEPGKIVVELWVAWPDERRRDIHNLHKLVADALEGVAYDDDRVALIRDMDYTVDRDDPRLVVRWERMEGTR